MSRNGRRITARRCTSTPICPRMRRRDRRAVGIVRDLAGSGEAARATRVCRRRPPWRRVPVPRGSGERCACARRRRCARARRRVVRARRRMRCDHVATTRLVIWGSGFVAELPDVRGGYRWQSASVADNDHDAPLRELQRRMRQAEGQLAEQLASDGWTVVCDGPLSFVRSLTCRSAATSRPTIARCCRGASHVQDRRTLGGGQRTPLFVMLGPLQLLLRLSSVAPSHGPVARDRPARVPAERWASTRAAGRRPAQPRRCRASPASPHRPARAAEPAADRRAREQLRHRLGHPRQAAMAVRAAARPLPAAADSRPPEGSIMSETRRATRRTSRTRPSRPGRRLGAGHHRRFHVCSTTTPSSSSTTWSARTDGCPTAASSPTTGSWSSRAGYIEGAELASDTRAIAVDAAPCPGAARPARRGADPAHRARAVACAAPGAVGAAAPPARTATHALFLDQMEQPLAVGLDQSGEPVYADFAFINGEKGGHVSISRHLRRRHQDLLRAVPALHAVRDRGGPRSCSARTRRTRARSCSTSRARTCCTSTGRTPLRRRRAAARWARARRRRARAVQRVSPLRRRARRRQSRSAWRRTSELAHERRGRAFGWTPVEFIRQGLLRFCFTEDEDARTQVGFVEQRVRVQLAR